MLDLTAHQQEKENEILGHIRAGRNRILLLGSAGTGKTFLAGHMAKLFRRDHTLNPAYNNGTVYAVAPTNKALAVLKSKIDANIAFKTMHSAVKLVKRTDRYSGISSFVKAKTWGKPKGDEFDKCKIAIADESSMYEVRFIGNGLPQVLENGDPNPAFVKGFLEDYKMPIIFMGDEKQLPPVNEPFSYVFHRDYPVVRLTEILRQGEGNPIIELSNDLDLLYFNTPSLVGGKGYVYSNDRNGFIESLAEVNGTDELKYLAFMNNDVNAINDAVRNRRYDNRPQRIEKQETIVFNAPFGSFYTNQEVKVEDVDVITDYVNVPTNKTIFHYDADPTGPMDRIKMKYYVVNESFRVVHEHSDFMAANIAANIKSNCANYQWDYRARDYFSDQFADITYNHAITVHKSQGSTYKETIVNVGNILRQSDVDQQRRMLYTAVTRASDLLILNNVPS